MVKDYAVFRDVNRHTAIRVEVGLKKTKFIRMSMEEMRVEALSTSEFAAEFTEMQDYTPQRAAQRYMYQGDGVRVPITQEALGHLQLMAGPAFKRESLLNDPAPVIESSTPKESTTMSEAQTAAPAKRKAPPPKAASEAPKKAKATAAPAKKAAAKPAKKVEAEAGTRGRQPNVAGTAKIKILVKDNPKRAAAAERYALYKNGMTVDEYIAAGGKRADINWDVLQGFIEVK